METTSSVKLVKFLVIFLGIFLLLYITRYFLINRTRKPSLAFSSQKITHKQSVEAGNTAYTTYKITVPKGWTVTRDSKNDIYDILTVVKNLYRIEILQKKQQEYLSCDVIFQPSNDVLGESIARFVEIKGNDNKVYRRSMLPPNPKAPKSSDTVCEKKDTGYMLPTTFGTISFEAPLETDPATIREMDEMIQSLQQVD